MKSRAVDDQNWSKSPVQKNAFSPLETNGRADGNQKPASLIEHVRLCMGIHVQCFDLQKRYKTGLVSLVTMQDTTRHFEFVLRVNNNCIVASVTSLVALYLSGVAQTDFV